MRDVAGRLAWFRTHRPDIDGDGDPDAGACANHVWRSLDIVRAGYPDAASAYRNLAARGLVESGPAPRGSIHLWTGGGKGFGHAALAEANNIVLSTDVNGPETVGTVPLSWFKQHWGNLTYRGWTWWWGNVNTEPKEVVVAPKPYIMLKVETDQKLTLNKWTKADIGTPGDTALPPVGADDWDFYINVDFTTLVGSGRNDLRYILGRWARHDPSSLDSGDNGMDETGADTKAISPDLPKGLGRWTWTHGFKGEAGVPVSFWLYIGSMKEGSVVSHMRIYKVDDET